MDQREWDKDVLSRMGARVLTKEEWLARHPEDIENIRRNDALREKHEEALYHAKLLQEALMRAKEEDDAIWDAKIDDEMANSDEDLGEMDDYGGKHMMELHTRRNPKTALRQMGYEVDYDFEVPDWWFELKSPDVQKTELVKMIKAFNRRKEEENNDERTPV